MRSGARRLGTAALLAVATLLCAGAATAHAGPGVTIKQGANSPTRLISGAQIAASGGLSLRGLLSLAGYNPGAVRYVQVVGGDGSVITVNNAELGSATVTDDGTTTRFAKGGATQVESVPGTPLEMTVGGNSLLSVRASASPTTVKVGQTVSFEASVRFRPPASYTYTWDFGDGSSASGASVSHRYQASGDITVRVTVRGTGGSTAQCASECEGTQTVDVTVTGQTRDGDLGTPQGGGGASSLGGTGTGGTGSGPGGGGGGTDPLGTGTSAPLQPRPTRAERPEPRSPFSSDPDSGVGKTIVQGVLLAGQGEAITESLRRGAEAGSPRPQQGTAGIASDPSQVAGAVAFALALMTLGALRERRRVRLRVA